MHTHQVAVRSEDSTAGHGAVQRPIAGAAHNAHIKRTKQAQGTADSVASRHCLVNVAIGPRRKWKLPTWGEAN